LNGLSEYPQVTRDDVLAASDRVSAAVLRTPLIETEIRGRRLWLKCECLQTGGSFKLRGATNRLALLSAEERERGVVAFSSGNHAQGVAIAAKRLGIRAIIVMPSDAPKLKIEGTRAQGAEVTLYDRRSEDRVAISARIRSEDGRGGQ
jgi:threonine dehydratase